MASHKQEKTVSGSIIESRDAPKKAFAHAGSHQRTPLHNLISGKNDSAKPLDEFVRGWRITRITSNECKRTQRCFFVVSGKKSSKTAKFLAFETQN
jgi:hypothetical protein